MMIAIGVLAIGLIMIAAIFPAALVTHRDSVDRSRGNEIFTKAEALMRGRLDPLRLWVAPMLIPGNPTAGPPWVGRDSPWYLLPFPNLAAGATAWDGMSVPTPPTVPSPGANWYANVLNGAVNVPNDGNPIVFYGLDFLGERIAPFTNNDPSSPYTDDEFMAAPNRYLWYGFYRRMGNGSVKYAAAICRQQRNQRYVQQDVSTAPGPVVPAVGWGSARRLPVPWRVTCKYNPPPPFGTGPQGSEKRIFNITGIGEEGLGELAPPGSKIMIAGGIYWQSPPPPQPPDPASLPDIPAGRVLTVVNVYDNSADGRDNPETIEVLEDLRDLPTQYTTPPPASSTYSFFFDVWVFPPEVTNVDASSDPPNITFGKTAPILDWKAFL